MSIVLTGNPAWAGMWACDTQAVAVTLDVIAGSVRRTIQSAGNPCMDRGKRADEKDGAYPLLHQ